MGALEIDMKKIMIKIILTKMFKINQKKNFTIQKIIQLMIVKMVNKRIIIIIGIIL